MRYRDRDGKRRLESTFTDDWDEAQKRMRERLQARDNNTLEVIRKGERLRFSEWADFFLENYSQPPVLSPKAHDVNVRMVQNLRKAFDEMKMADITADGIEAYLRFRLRQPKRVKTAIGYRELGKLKPSTVHQEFRVLRRVLNVAVKKKLIPANPCAGVEFPARIDGLFRPHYMSWSEQQKIEFCAPEYLKNVIRIVTETGLRIYRELTPMRKEQVDLVNKVVWIPASKTPNGVAEVPLTEMDAEAFRSQIKFAGPGPHLFPCDRNPRGYQGSFRNIWTVTLKRAGVPYFRIYDLRSTYATRLSAGGVADEWVVQLLRQGDAKVFKKYSQMKLQMKREALQKINRHANEAMLSFDTARSN